MSILSTEDEYVAAMLLGSYFGEAETPSGEVVKVHKSLLGLGRAARRAIKTTKDIGGAFKAFDNKMDRMNTNILNTGVHKVEASEHKWWTIIKLVVIAEIINLIQAAIVDLFGYLVFVTLGLLAAEIFIVITWAIGAYLLFRFIRSFLNWRQEMKADYAMNHDGAAAPTTKELVSARLARVKASRAEKASKKHVATLATLAAS